MNINHPWADECWIYSHTLQNFSSTQGLFTHLWKHELVWQSLVERKTLLAIYCFFFFLFPHSAISLLTKCFVIEKEEKEELWLTIFTFEIICVLCWTSQAGLIVYAILSLGKSWVLGYRPKITVTFANVFSHSLGLYKEDVRRENIDSISFIYWTPKLEKNFYLGKKV